MHNMVNLCSSTLKYRVWAAEILRADVLSRSIHDSAPPWAHPDVNDVSTNSLAKDEGSLKQLQ